MALKKAPAERFLKMTKTNCRISTSACSVTTRIISDSGSDSSISPEPGDARIFRRLFHMKSIIQPGLPPPESLFDRLRGIDFPRDRIRLDGLIPPALEPEVTVEDARKLLRLAQLEAIKSRLRDMDRSWVPYSEFIRIVMDTCPDPDQGGRVAQTLDESGSVIVVGNVVHLQPDQESRTLFRQMSPQVYKIDNCFEFPTFVVVKAIGGLIPLPAINPNDLRRKELQELEKRNSAIDKEANAQVRRELWAGLVYLVVQTAGFIRLTFWELSWDVMEPISFYVTAMYGMVGYAFFMRTSKEPSFQGFYKSRFVAKQRKLMRLQNFDAERYNELRKICYPNSSNSLDVNNSFDQKNMYQTN